MATTEKVFHTAHPTESKSPEAMGSQVEKMLFTPFQSHNHHCSCQAKGVSVHPT